MAVSNLDDFATSVTFDENTVNATPQLLDMDVTFVNAVGDFDGGMLTLTGVLAEDTVSVRNEGTGAGQIGFVGSSVTYGGVIIGSVPLGSGGPGAPLTITFNAAATTAAVDALIQNLTYANNSNAPTASRDLRLNVEDADGDVLTPSDFSFTQMSDATNPFSSFDLGGSNRIPTFVDLDGDLDLDLVVGAFDGTLGVLRNNGDQTFTQLTGTSNPFDGIDVGIYSAPSFVDIDGDGDLDAVIGNGNTFALRVFENTSSGTSFVEVTGANNPFDGVSLSARIFPTFTDLDGDGDLDAVIGDSFGTFRVFDNNDGDLGFTELTGAQNPFNGIDIGGQGRPTFVDLDMDGDLDAVFGEYYGHLQVYDNNDADSGFTQLTGAANPLDGVHVDYFGSTAFRVSPSFYDVDGDGDMDAVLGANIGELTLFENPMNPLGQTITVNVIAQNEAPTLGLLEASVTFAENTVNTTPLLLDNDVIFEDFENNFLAGSVTVSGLLPEDVISVASPGGGFHTIGNTVFYQEAPVGTWTGGNGTPFVLTIIGLGNGSVASIDALLENITYSNTSDNPTASRDLNITIVDSEGGTVTEVITVNVTPEGDATTIAGLVSDITVVEDTTFDVDLSSVTIADGDENPSFTLTLAADSGVLNASSTAMVSVTGDGTGALVLTGIAADIDVYLNDGSAIKYTGAQDVNGADAAVITLTANDGAGDIALGSVNVDIDGVNDAPMLTDLTPSVTFGENTVNAAAQLLDMDVTFIDADGNFDGGMLSLTGLLAEDTVSVNDQGTGAGEIGFSGADVSFGGVVIGTLAGGVGGALTITFNAAATSAAVDALIQNLTYANSSGTPTASRHLLLNVVDAAGGDFGVLQGTPSFTELTGTANPFDGISAGYRSAPTFVDLDGDGDLDVVLGDLFGTVSVFDNNDGDNGFTELTGAANPFDAIELSFNSSPAFIDLDGDGDLDLVLGENDGSLRVYDNNDADADFSELTGVANPLDGFDVGYASNPTIVDLDGDGDLDIVVGENDGKLIVFDNNDADNGFTELTGASDPFDGTRFVTIYNNPSFADLDGDGDLDIVIGSGDGTLQVFDNNDAGDGYTELTGAANPFDGVDVGERSAPDFVDLDGDGDLDLVVGENGGALFTFENTTPHGQVISVAVSAENDAPTLTDLAPSVTFDENTVNTTPQLLDIDVTFTDLEGNFDAGVLSLAGLLAEDTVSVRTQGTGAGEISLSGPTVSFGGVAIGTLAGGVGSSLTITFNAAATNDAIDALIQNLTYANNSDTPTASRDLVLNVTDAAGADFGALLGIPSFAELTGTSNPFDGLDLGFGAAPIFVDLDGDGDLDAVVGDGYGNINVFDNNDGDAGFTAITGIANPFDGIDVGNESTPTFVDLDGDGDLDMVVGDIYGTLSVFDNNDADDGFTELTGAANPLDGIDVGDFSDPSFVDLDGDGDLDIVVGDRYAVLQVFDNNDGDAGFTAVTGMANPFDGIDVFYESSPTFIDLDGDGDLDLVVGSYNDIRVWDNNDADAGFTELTGTSNPFSGLSIGNLSNPSFVDLDNDGDLDLVVGDGSGGLRSYENTTPHGLSITVGVSAQNDATTLNGLESDVTVVEDTASDVDLSAVILGDADLNPGFTLTLTANSGVLNGTSAGSVTVTGAGTGVLVLTGLAADIDAYLNDGSAIQYTGAQNVNGEDAAVITLIANDGTGDIALGSVNVDITAQSDPTTLTGLISDVTVLEDVAANLNLSAVVLSDLDGNSGFALTLTASGGTLSAASSGLVTVSGAETGTLVLTGLSSDIDAYLNNVSAIQYTGAQNINGDAAASIVLSANDGNGDEALGALTVDILAINDAPTITGLPSTMNADEAISANVDLSAVTLEDIEDDFVLVTITATSGQLDAVPSGGVFVLLAGGNTLQLSGSVAALNAYLQNANAVQFTGAQNIFGDGATTLTVLATDLQGAQVVQGAVQIDIADVIETQTGDAGDNQLLGNIGRDILLGDAGSDTLIGDAGNDTLNGGIGDDTLNGGDGFDTAVFEGMLDTTVDLRIITAQVTGQGLDTLSEFEALVTAAGSDSLTGTDCANHFDSGDGNDTIFGEGGDDTIQAGKGADDVKGGLGNDDISGGKGDDSLFGAKGNDTLDGGGGQDVLDGYNGADDLFGGSGNDTLNGGLGADTLDGGADFDTVLFTGNTDTTVDLRMAVAQDTGHGLDTLNAIEALVTGTGNDMLTGTNTANHFESSDGNDTVLAEGGDDTVQAGKGLDDVKGGLGNDDISGGKGDDSLLGGKGDDTLNGGGGRDVLDGYNGADAIYGGADGDWLNGGKGNDLLVGGAGSDDFIFKSGDGDDTIKDYDALNSKEDINLAAVAEIVDFADLSANHMTQLGDDVVIDDGDALTITLLNVDLVDLGQYDFIF